MGWNIFSKEEICKTISQRDIDLIRVEAEAITSTDDKVYLLKDLYKHIEAVEKALQLLESPETAPKVQQSRDELLRLQKSMEEVRTYIIGAPLPVKRFGLFVKYPKGYEG